MTLPFRLDEARVREGMDHLARLDPRIAEARAIYGDPPLRVMDEGFAALLRSIVGQQVSVAAARSIWNRVEAMLDPVTPERVLARADEDLRACGLSNNKVKFARALALDTAERRIVFEELAALDDDTIVAHLTRAKGIGRWTAEIYMMFALGRPDVMPAADLGLMTAAQHLLKLRRRPDQKRLLKLTMPWRPWRSVASLFLWHYRHNMPDFSDSPAAVARREAERAAKAARAAARPQRVAAPVAAKKPAPKAAAERKTARKAPTAKSATTKRATARKPVARAR